MVQRLLSLFAGFFLIFSLLSLPGLAESCSFSGTLEINGIKGSSVMVTAHDSETGEFLVSGWEGIEKGRFYLEAESGSVTFRIMDIPVDQGPQSCESRESNEINLTASTCRDCDSDGFESLLWGGEDCDDRNPDVNPYKRETCGNGIDDDCDGLDSTCLDCDEDWSCTGWSECVNGEQSRVCIEENECGTTDHKPAQEQVCAIFNAGIICYDGELTCDGDLLMECFAGQWRQSEVCEFGCIDDECESGGITGMIVANPTAFWGMILLIIIILTGAAYWRARY